jgi:hypothetical protein
MVGGEWCVAGGEVWAVGCYLSDVLLASILFTKENPDKKSFFFWFGVSEFFRLFWVWGWSA